MSVSVKSLLLASAHNVSTCYIQLYLVPITIRSGWTILTLPLLKIVQWKSICKLGPCWLLFCFFFLLLSSVPSSQGHHAETLLNRVLPGPIAPDSSKKRARRTRPDLSKMMALMQGGGTGSLSLHNTFQHSSSGLQSVSSLGHSSATSASLPFMPFVMGGAASSPHVDSSTMLHHHHHHPHPHHHHHHHPGLRATGYPSSPATTTSATALRLPPLQPEEDEDDEDEDDDDDLSQGYDSSERDFSLIDDPMMPANSDSSEDADDWRPSMVPIAWVAAVFHLLWPLDYGKVGGAGEMWGDPGLQEVKRKKNTCTWLLPNLRGLGG